MARADATAAESLFRRGRELLEQGQPAEACRVLSESQRLYPSSGTLLNLGDCSEQQGKTATAWSFFIEAKRFAQTTGRDAHAEEAQRRMDLLKPKLSFIVVRAPHKVPGLSVLRNDVELDPAQFGVRTPADPGHYEVVAKAPGYLTWRTSVEVGANAAAREVVVPKLVPVAAPAPPTAAPAAAPSPAPPRAAPRSERTDEGGGVPTASIVFAGFGAAALVAGGIAGVLALRSYSDAESACPDRTGCSDDAMNARDRAGTEALISDIALGVGVLSLGAATYFYFSTSSEQPTRDEPSTARARRMNLGLTGRF